MSRIERIGPHTLILGDCREWVAALSVDAVVTDPPYGIGACTHNFYHAVQRKGAWCQSIDYGNADWDDEPASDEDIDSIRQNSHHQVIFGGNYFKLPPARCWLVWDKLNGENQYSDCELAWTNLDKPVRRLVWQWHGMIRRGHEERFHPTQKPVGVMRWCLSQLPENAKIILDPFMGSGSTGVACVEAGLDFVGIERHERYFEIACRRISGAARQPDLFIKRVSTAKQQSLFASVIHPGS